MTWIGGRHCLTNNQAKLIAHPEMGLKCDGQPTLRLGGRLSGGEQTYFRQVLNFAFVPTDDIRSVPPIVNLVVYKVPEFPALSAARFGVTERVQ